MLETNIGYVFNISYIAVEKWSLSNTMLFVTETICVLSSLVTIRGAARTVGTAPACPALPCVARWRGLLPVRCHRAAPADGQGLQGWPLWAGLPACRRPSSLPRAGASCRPSDARYGSVPCRPSVACLWAFLGPWRGFPAVGLALVLLLASWRAWRASVTETKGTVRPTSAKRPRDD